MHTSYAVVTIGFKQPELMAKVLTQLAAQTVLPTEVLIVDNGGTFTERDRSEWSLADRSTLVSRPDNPGYAAAVNEARSRSGAALLLVLTHDAEFEADLAAKLCAVFTHNGVAQSATADVGSAGPVLYFRDSPEKLFSAGGTLTRSGLAAHLRAPKSKLPYPVDWVDGAIVMFSRAALDAIGWLDEQYFLYFEDVDTGWRLNQAGYRNVIAPSAFAKQQPGAHPPYLGMRNMALFARKAGISRARLTLAVLPRMMRVAAGQLKRRKAVQVSEMFRGLRDGYRASGVEAT